MLSLLRFGQIAHYSIDPVFAQSLNAGKMVSSPAANLLLLGLHFTIARHIHHTPGISWSAHPAPAVLPIPALCYCPPVSSSQHPHSAKIYFQSQIALATTMTPCSNLGPPHGISLFSTLNSSSPDCFSLLFWISHSIFLAWNSCRGRRIAET